MRRIPAKPYYILTERGFGYKFAEKSGGGDWMKISLLWKLLLINILPVIGVTILVVWLAIDQLAANYFMALMTKYDVSPTDIHQIFLRRSIDIFSGPALRPWLWLLYSAFFLLAGCCGRFPRCSPSSAKCPGGNFSRRVATRIPG